MGSFSAGIAASWKFHPRVPYFETIHPDWPAVWSSSLVTKVALSSTNAETAGEIWAFVSVHCLPPWVPFISGGLTRAFFHFISDSKNTRLLCCLCLVELLVCLLLLVKRLCFSWPALVSPDSYIVNQSSFSSINDKDLHYYKNLRNLWVCVTPSDCLHTRICFNAVQFDCLGINNTSYLVNRPCDCERFFFDPAQMSHFM